MNRRRTPRSSSCWWRPSSRRATLVAAALFWVFVGGRTDLWAQFDALPPTPPYCYAGQNGHAHDGRHTADGSDYCLERVVDDNYVEPPEGWDSHVGTFTIVTTLSPLSPTPSFYPVLPNYPHVVLEYHGANYPRWPDNVIADGVGSGGLTGNEIEIVRVLDCAPTDHSCDYEVRPMKGSPGSPPEWFQPTIPEDVDGNGPGLDLFPFADIGVGIGIVATLQDIVTCVDCVTELKVDCATLAAVPAFAAYPSGCSP